MNPEKNYSRTVTACFAGYVVQAIVNNYAPLLFLTWRKQYGLPLGLITALIAVNFVIQLFIDLASALFVDRLGYRFCLVAAHASACAGFVALAFLPDLFPSPFAGLLIAVCLYAVGGGLIEVLVSPVIEACPTPDKKKAMSLLHSFYCWGQVGVILLSTLFFAVFGVNVWRYLALIWALLPLINGLCFMNVPLAPLLKNKETSLGVKKLLSLRSFRLYFLLILCAGASEMAMSQWASSFAEEGLGVSKTIGDLLGPAGFAAMMGLSRLLYGKYGERINLDRFMKVSGLLGVIAFLTAGLVPHALTGLCALALGGFAVGIMWPGAFSRASAFIKNGGTAMFALLALGGDLGCAIGPGLTGLIAASASDSLKAGLTAAVIFPSIILIALKAVDGLPKDK